MSFLVLPLHLLSYSAAAVVVVFDGGFPESFYSAFLLGEIGINMGRLRARRISESFYISFLLAGRLMVLLCTVDGGLLVEL
jgi:hypothetical protein